jgi:hypothetical protein
MRGNGTASLLIVLLIALVVVGFMRGWFAFNSVQQPSGKVNLELSVDPNQAQRDAKQLERRTDEFFDKVRSDVTDPRDTTVLPEPATP